MGTTLATKQDLESLRVATKQDLLPLATREGLLATRQDLQLLEQRVNGRFALLEQKVDGFRGDLSRDLAAMELKMTIKLGSMIVVCFGLTIAAMRLWMVPLR